MTYDQHTHCSCQHPQYVRTDVGSFIGSVIRIIFFIAAIQFVGMLFMIILMTLKFWSIPVFLLVILFARIFYVIKRDGWAYHKAEFMRTYEEEKRKREQEKMA